MCLQVICKYNYKVFYFFFPLEETLLILLAYTEIHASLQYLHPPWSFSLGKCEGGHNVNGRHLPPGLPRPKLHEMQLKGHFPEGPPSNITGRTPSAALVRLSGILIHVTQVTTLRMPGHSEHCQDLLLLSCIHLRRATGSIFNNEKHF